MTEIPLLPDELEALRQRISAAPDDHDAWFALGRAEFHQGNLPAAVAAFSAPVRAEPENAQFRRRFADLLSAAGALADASEQYIAAYALAPDDPTILCSLADTLAELRRYGDAEMCYREALVLAPRSAPVLNNFANMLQKIGREAEAEGYYRTTLEIDPTHAEAASNLGILASRLGQLDESIRHFQHALRLKPGLRAAHESMAWAMLALGRFEEGWREHDAARFVAGPVSPSRGFSQPLWQGESLAGRTLLIHAEHGFGDSLLFCRYIRLLPQDGCILLEVPARLVRLLSDLCEPGCLILEGSPLPEFDVHLPMMSFPRVFGTTLETVPNEVPYLAAAPDDVASWSDRLKHLEGLRVGLVWAGNPSQGADERRSMPLSFAAPLFDLPGIAFVSLQIGPEAERLPRSEWAGKLYDPAPEIDDFADTAAVIAALDLVIAVDTAVLHLAGALGKPVWLLNRWDSCWRWMRDRDDSPWYPTLRQFRQTSPGDWSGVIARVAEALVTLRDMPDERS